jgi:hypothetical protein
LRTAPTLCIVEKMDDSSDDLDDLVVQRSPQAPDCAERLRETFSESIEGVAAETLRCLRRRLAERYANDPECVEVIAIIDVELALRNMDVRGKTQL